MEENYIPEKEKLPEFLSIVIIEAAVAIVILATVLTVKLFFSDCYNELKIFYETDICANTDPDEVIKVAENNNIKDSETNEIQIV